jgi:hypothetical protein
MGQIRRKSWGFAKNEALAKDDLLNVKYQGIRPAPGYPSQPDHTEKRAMWDLMDITKTSGIELTESMAMMPAAAVSALVFSHPQASYFAVDKIGKDQVNDYAARKKMKVEDVEKWLEASLNYDLSVDAVDQKSPAPKPAEAVAALPLPSSHMCLVIDSGFACACVCSQKSAAAPAATAAAAAAAPSAAGAKAAAPAATAAPAPAKK